MKTKNLLIVSIVMLTMTLNSFAQSVASAGASASVIVPIGVVKVADMNFGNAAVSATSGGMITLAPSGARTIGGTGVTLPGTTGTVAAAGFVVTGAPGYTYAITLPSSTVITGPGSATMTLNGFTSTPTTTGTLSSAGTQTLAVGASLVVSAAQVPGTYTNATAVPVTVNYN